ncbi:MAG: stage 0 sporulation family protein [Syntrophothermus sp.]
MNNDIDIKEGCGCRKAHSPYQNTELYNDVLIQCLSSEQLLGGCSVCGSENPTKVPKDERNIVEASTKGILGSFYCTFPDELKGEIHPEEMIIVGTPDMTEVAKVIEAGDIVSIKRQRIGLFAEVLPEMIRKVNDEDRLVLEKNAHEETKAHEIFKVKVQKYNLNMKLVDIHYQFDRNKLYFFYTADGRVDFRELAKDLAASFRTRIELRQIGVRDEAKRIGGLGTCGREFCCASFLNNFKKITTQLASEQNLASSFSKLSGPCGKLKCCLSFEPKDGSHDESAEQAPAAEGKAEA